MTSKTRKLIIPTLLSTTADVYYQTPVSTNTVVRKIAFYNTSSSVVEISLYIVSSGDISEPKNLILKRKIAAGESFEFLGAVNDVMIEGDTIQAKASIENAVNIRGSGSEIVES